MNKKTWKEKLAGIKKLLAQSEFNKQREIDNIEELTLMIEFFTSKIATFK